MEESRTPTDEDRKDMPSFEVTYAESSLMRSEVPRGQGEGFDWGDDRARIKYTYSMHNNEISGCLTDIAKLIRIYLYLLYSVSMKWGSPPR